jgi:hypothetical protein
MIPKIRLSKITTAAIAAIAAMAAIGGIGQQQIALALEIGPNVGPILDDINEAFDEAGVDREIACPEDWQVNGFCGPLTEVPVGPSDNPDIGLLCMNPYIICKGGP